MYWNARTPPTTVSILLLLGFAGIAGAGVQTRATRRTLDQVTVVQGYPCAKGYAWFFPDGKLQKCTVANEIAFGEAVVPAGSMIALTAAGAPDYVQPAHDIELLGMTCMGAGILGVAEGPVVAFYPSGKVKVCFLAKAQEVQGIPCEAGGFWATILGGDPGVYFYESGRLKQCRLARDFRGQKRGAVFRQ